MARTAINPLLACILACCCCAQTTGHKPGVIWTPPEIKFTGNLPKPAGPKGMIGSVTVGGFRIDMPSTTLKQAQRHFGGMIGRQGGGAIEENAWLCLNGTDVSGSWILWLESGEYDDLNYISRFTWKPLSENEKADKRCAAVPQGGEIYLPLKLRLGMLEGEVRQSLGRPSVVKGNTLVYCHFKQPSSRSDGLLNDVYVFMRKGQVWMIHAEQDIPD